MSRQAIIGIAEVPQVIGDDEDPSHVRPEHILALLGDIDAEPPGHAGDIQKARYAIEHIMPATVQYHAFGGYPARTPGTESALEIRCHSDQDIDGHDDERECLEPVRTAHLAPRILQHHEADAPRCSRIDLRVMEPAIHIRMGRVVQCPFGTHGSADLHR